ncbi:MAG: hypothetical protein JSS49_29510 [Planctomycetes bacterium]|nr:hypothetical protein [Planctomycetota bacterium]
MFSVSALLVTGGICLVQMTVRADEVDELRSRAKVMLQKSAHAAEDGQKEEAEELERGSQKLLKAAEQLEQERARRRELEVSERKVPKKGEGGRTASEVHRIESDRKLDPRERKPVRGESPELAELAERLQHARIAADNLRAAGLVDLANATAERVHEMENHLHEMKEMLHHTSRENRLDPRDEALQDLRVQMQELREELQLLRKKLSK